ncbi:MAG: DUF4325 domain-containing protein [Candidatus Kuenenbacteria bacterium]
MKLSNKKFGTILIGRDSGREAFIAFLPSLNKIKDNEKIEVDFEGVDVFSPSWGDEFLSSLLKKFNNRVVLKNTTNPSVKSVIEFLEKIHKMKFNVES